MFIKIVSNIIAVRNSYLVKLVNVAFIHSCCSGLFTGDVALATSWWTGRPLDELNEINLGQVISSRTGFMLSGKKRSLSNITVGSSRFFSESQTSGCLHCTCL